MGSQVGCRRAGWLLRRTSRGPARVDEEEHDRAVARRTWRRRNTSLRRQTKTLVALAAATAALSLLLALSGCGHRSQLSVTIAGRRERIPEGTTLAEAAATFDLRPQAGDLLDVRGRALQAGVVPGWLLFDR